MNRDVKVFAERSNFGRHVDVQLVIPDRHGDPGKIAMPVEFVDIPADSDRGLHLGAALHMHTEVAQQLIDALWDCGLRPTQGKQSEGQFAAQGRHLDDMRTLVAKLTKVELPK